MNNYSKEQTSGIHHQRFHFLLIEETGHVLNITLNREAKKNALHPQMLNEIAYAMCYAAQHAHVWMVILSAKGNVFCSGADLQAAMGMAEEHHSTIPLPLGEVLIAELFNKIHKPTIARVEGDVFAGGILFLAGCHIVISNSGVKFGLPEVKKGLYPFQVMAALLRVMPSRKVIDWCIRGYNLSAEQALQYGLITEIADSGNMDEVINRIVEELKQNSPAAIRLGLEAYTRTIRDGADHNYLMGMLNQAITSKDGQEGLMAFIQKRKPVWTGE